MLKGDSKYLHAIYPAFLNDFQGNMLPRQNEDGDYASSEGIQYALEL